ncbi:hypothetical protein X802_02545 [Thermococcus guaymasensis DSM 11113]|uniref:Putative glycogen debranching enzyme N-terminal domain-containing protein n=1 Tax=Thermococcus guaymasensis DSM 11113 TaxID=1432656 RepID=A0A0X1KN32_9EURY|nr:glycogen debranching N-terminal domain-containing protein [Thermococcus guaymasensis]AJC72667.1 hypothetical protein X802_02545 [Thermococcus guaymasensis DSM 11113]
MGVSIEGTKLLEVSGEEGITAVYRAGKCYVIRRITTGNGYHDRVLVFNPTHSPVELDVAFSYSTPFEDILEADWGRVERHPLREGNTLVWKGADGRVRRLKIEEKSGKIPELFAGSVRKLPAGVERRRCARDAEGSGGGRKVKPENSGFEPKFGLVEVGANFRRIPRESARFYGTVAREKRLKLNSWEEPTF